MTETTTDYLDRLEQTCPLAVAMWRLHHAIRSNTIDRRFGEHRFTDEEIAAAEARVRELMNGETL